MRIVLHHHLPSVVKRIFDPKHGILKLTNKIDENVTRAIISKLFKAEMTIHS